MPIITNKDGTKEIVDGCKGYCTLKLDSKTCGFGCKNKENLDMRKIGQDFLDKVQKKLY